MYLEVAGEGPSPCLRDPGSTPAVVRVHSRVKWPGGSGGDCHWTKQGSDRDSPALWDEEAKEQMMGMKRTWQPRLGDMERPV